MKVLLRKPWLMQKNPLESQDPTTVLLVISISCIFARVLDTRNSHLESSDGGRAGRFFTWIRQSPSRVNTIPDESWPIGHPGL